MRKIALLAALGAFIPASATAAGFAVGEQGSAALGVAGAATALPNHADSGFYNPANYALNPGFRTSVGVALVSPTFSHSDTIETTADTGLETPPYAYVGYGADLGDWSLGGNLAFGVPFGAGLAWPVDWPGRYEVTAIALRVFEINTNLAVGYHSGDFRVALSAGPRYLLSTVALQKRIDAVDLDGRVELSGDDQAWGFQTAAIAQFKGFSLGVNYRNRVALDFEGAADFENIPLELSTRTPDQAVETAVTLPDRLAVGAAFDHGDGTVSLDVETYFWSTFASFGIEFVNPATPDVDEPREWSNTTAFRLGYEYRGLLEGLALRGGIAWDPTPSPTDTLSPTLPDSDRFVGTLGGGYTLGIGLTIHGSYAHVFLADVTATGDDVFPGTYQGSANIVSLGLSYDM